MYQSFQRFTELFLADTSGVRTENPWEANMFFVPTFAFYTTSRRAGGENRAASGLCRASRRAALGRFVRD